jgi:hypothetical protein
MACDIQVDKGMNSVMQILASDGSNLTFPLAGKHFKLDLKLKLEHLNCFSLFPKTLNF